MSLLLLVGLSVCFVFALKVGTAQTVACLCGFLLSFFLAPALHELGHVLLAKKENMACVYVKFFCFKVYKKAGQSGFGWASPFAADETQVLPKCGGNMQRRAIGYTLGGISFSGALFIILLTLALTLTFMNRICYFVWGMLPYAAYLFLLNLPPVEYASGKTDTLVYLGIKRGADVEKCMLSVMEIQGQLYEGKRFSEIPQSYYFDLPQLVEEEPLFALVLDLRYRYYLDKEELDSAADCLNRLALTQAYLSDKELEKVAAELVYMHSLRGDIERAEESGKLCKAFLSGNSATAKRILAAYSQAAGKTEAVEPLKAQGREALSCEWIAGVRKFEEGLLSRIKS